MKRILGFPLAMIRLVFTSWWLALGQIWANKTRSILTTIGIVIGVASVVAVIASLSGLKAKILSQVETLGSNTIFISTRRPDTGPKSHLSWWQVRFREREFKDMLVHCPSVGVFTLRAWMGQHTVKYGEKSTQNVGLVGVEPAWHEIENRALVSGREMSEIDESRAVCLIEQGLRDKLQMDRDCEGQTIRIGHRNFRIIGVIEKRPEIGFGEGQREYYEIFAPFRTVSKFGEPWINVMAASKSTEVSEEAVAEIKFFLRRTRNIKPGEPDTFRVESLKSAIKTFNEIAFVVTLVAGGIVGISLLVGGVGIMNIMLVSISERTREIGLRKAVGAKKSAILTQFLVEAVILCFVGGLVGIGFGKLLTLIISGMIPLLERMYIPLWAIGLSFGFSGAVGLFFGMFPAIKAARLDPIEALRHE